MAMQDNTVLPAAAPTPTGAGGMNPQIQAFLNLLMGGGLSEFGAFGGQPFGGFGNFLMQNPALMRGLGLTGFGGLPDRAIPEEAPGAGGAGGVPVAPPSDTNVLTAGTPPPSTGTNPLAGGVSLVANPTVNPATVPLGGGAPVDPTATPLGGGASFGASGLPLPPMLRKA